MFVSQADCEARCGTPGTEEEGTKEEGEATEKGCEGTEGGCCPDGSAHLANGKCCEFERFEVFIQRLDLWFLVSLCSVLPVNGLEQGLLDVPFLLN